MSDYLPNGTIRARLVIKGLEDDVRHFAAASGIGFETMTKSSREMPGRDAGNLLQEVLDAVELGLVKWRELGSPGAVRMWLQIVTYIRECQGPALAFEPDLIKQIAATGLLLDIDVYCLGEERKSDAHE